MKKLIFLALAASTVAGTAAVNAEAAQGCGRGFHRGPYGRCHPNARAYVAPVLVIHRFYPGRGYWDGRRYWWHRDRWHGGWRYR